MLRASIAVDLFGNRAVFLDVMSPVLRSCGNMISRTKYIQFSNDAYITSTSISILTHSTDTSYQHCDQRFTADLRNLKGSPALVVTGFVAFIPTPLLEVHTWVPTLLYTLRIISGSRSSTFIYV